jgi:hypothetical protein
MAVPGHYGRASHDDAVRRVLLIKQRHQRTILTAPAGPGDCLIGGYGTGPSPTARPTRTCTSWYRGKSAQRLLHPPAHRNRPKGCRQSGERLGHHPYRPATVENEGDTAMVAIMAE